MSRRHIAAFGAFLVLLIQVSFCTAAAPEKQPATAERPPSTAKDEYYEMYQVLVDTMDQVDRNYVQGDRPPRVDRGGHQGRAQQARPLLELHRARTS